MKIKMAKLIMCNKNKSSNDLCAQKKRKIKNIQRKVIKNIYHCHYKICVFSKSSKVARRQPGLRGTYFEQQCNRLRGYCLSSVVVTFASTEHEELKKWNKIDNQRIKKCESKIQGAEQV